MYYWDSTNHPYTEEISGTPYPKLFYLPMSFLVGDSNDMEWMQYTCLKDKNGKEIYEGDVVHIDHPAWREKCIVELSNGSFIFRALEEPSKDIVIPGYTFMRETWEVKVIGNIYENPELLCQ